MHPKTRNRNSGIVPHGATRLTSAVLLTAALSLGGCVVKRGVDFGHWARSGERVELVKMFVNRDRAQLTGNETFLLIPVLGSMPEQNRQDLQNNLLQEMRNYFPCRVGSVKKNSPLSEYIEAENLLENGHAMNPEEIGRVGQVAGTTHVICVLVNEFKAYQPQILSLTIQVIDSNLCTSIAELNANLDCAEQQVVMALADHLQSRESRKMDIQNLDLLLRSPTAFGAFASAKCARIMSDNLWPHKTLKQVISTADNEKDGTR